MDQFNLMLAILTWQAQAPDGEKRRAEVRFGEREVVIHLHRFLPGYPLTGKEYHIVRAMSYREIALSNFDMIAYHFQYAVAALNRAVPEGEPDAQPRQSSQEEGPQNPDPQ